jgi:hypothetical protein
VDMDECRICFRRGLDLRFRLARGKTHKHYFVGGFCCQPHIEIVRNDNSVFDV